MGTGTVYLLGAGPGDPELLTLRALRHLQRADVVLYDALVHPALLKHCSPSAKVEFVGKRAGRRSERQAAINDRLLQEAQAGHRVVRLKGGDPYLFGRGSEEAEYLAAHGVPFEVVPGVPSPVAATAYAGISLTHRDLSSSVAYITATESQEKDESSHDWSKLATGPETLVIFMGLRKLPSLMALLVQHGRSPDTPATVIQNASLGTQRTVVGTVADIADRVAAAGLGMPAITVVGPVVSLREKLRWFDRLPLFGRRVLITRPRHQAAEFAQALRDAGAEPVVAPTIQIVPPTAPAPLSAAAAALGSYDWVIFTSRNGVRAFFSELESQGLDARAFGNARVAAIGPATASSLRRRGIAPDVIPESYVAESVFTALQGAEKNMDGKRFLLPRAEVAREVLPNELRTTGAFVNVVSAYRTVPVSVAEQERIRSLIRDRAVDTVCFTAASTVRNLAAVMGNDVGAELRGITVACIGPITADAAKTMGIEVHVVAEEFTHQGLVDALCKHGRLADSPDAK